ncbi:MAG TPA: AI-2E family transporter [Acidobacteriaceae bacterium]|nr:AI-2E family transporter [Acidobacteriaceae bacterium]
MREAPRPDSEDRTNWKTAALFLLTLAVLSVCGLILYPFLAGITGAVVLAVVTRQPHHWWRKKIRSRTAAAVTSLLLVTISIIAPVLLLVDYLARQVASGAAKLEDGWVQRSLDALLERFPQIATAIEHSSEFMTLGEAAQKVIGYATSHLGAVLSNSLGAVSQVVIMLFLLFFLYRDEEVAVGFLRRLMPLTESETRLLVGRIGETIRATVLGRLVVALVQGTVAGTVFALLGVHGAVILGLLTATVGLVPPFGAYIVWLPVAAWFAINGHWVKMAILLAVGSLIISTLDNFLYPALVGTRLRQHTAAVFLSLLGGVWLFGLPGLVLGPLLFSAAEALLSIWRARMGEAGSETPFHSAGA